MVSPFILPCLPFCLTGEWKGDKSLKRCRWIVRFYLLRYANGQTCACVLDCNIRYNYYQAHWCRVPIQVNQDGFMLRLTCIFLSGDISIQLVLSSEYDDYDRLEDHFIMYWLTSQTTKYVTFYAWTNRLTGFSTCNLPITAASLC